MTNNTVTAPSAPKRSAHKEKLPPSFIPGEYSVICGRGKLCSASPGNKYLRSLVNENLNRYSMAKKKAEKSAIVCAIINRVRDASPVGAVVKQEDNGDWWEVDDAFAREKIGCIFRDVLHTQYRYSTRAKQARKKVLDTCDAWKIQQKVQVTVVGSSSSIPGQQERIRAVDGATWTGGWPSSQMSVSSRVAISDINAKTSLSSLLSEVTFSQDEDGQLQMCPRAVSPLAPPSLESMSLKGQLAFKSQEQDCRKWFHHSKSSTNTSFSIGQGCHLPFVHRGNQEQVQRLIPRKPNTETRACALSLLNDAIGVVDVEDFGMDADDNQDDLWDVFDDEVAKHPNQIPSGTCPWNNKLLG